MLFYSINPVNKKKEGIERKEETSIFSRIIKMILIKGKDVRKYNKNKGENYCVNIIMYALHAAIKL